MQNKHLIESKDIKNFIIQTKKNGHIEVSEFALPMSVKKTDSRKATKMQFEDSFLEGLAIAHEFEISWKSIHLDNPDVIGRVKILSLKEITQNWEGVVYFEDTDENDLIRSFYPVDFFVEEACVGIYAGDCQTDSLYFYQFEETPYRLDLDMQGYLEMILLTKGFLYWQYAIIEIHSGEENPQSIRFKKYMPQLFPEFSFEDFKKTYERLRLTKPSIDDSLVTDS